MLALGMPGLSLKNHTPSLALDILKPENCKSERFGPDHSRPRRSPKQYTWALQPRCPEKPRRFRSSNAASQTDPTDHLLNPGARDRRADGSPKSPEKERHRHRSRALRGLGRRGAGTAGEESGGEPRGVRTFGFFGALMLKVVQQVISYTS